MYRRLAAASRATLRTLASPCAFSLRFNSSAAVVQSDSVLGRSPYVLPNVRKEIHPATHNAAFVCGNRSFALLPLCGTQRRSFFSFSCVSQEEGITTASPLPSVTKTMTPSSVSKTDLATQTMDAAVTTSHIEAQNKLETKLTELRQLYLEPYDKVYHFLNPLKSTTPMVMLLGNHSSGKSTLINFLAGREIQETGVAPTDDGFTVIKRDTFDMDADGPSIVSNPKYQYQSLQQFGIAFVTHFKMKTRKMAETSQLPMNMVLIDTPGMIDTPVHSSERATVLSSTSDSMYCSDQTRGYDFLGVTRWFAQQSDVILLMFDPANPGTTGETLDVLTKSLAGFEHKFLLVLNKVDVFEKVTDFARAYGALCWNLSKVMRMKDIPRVYTTCTPLDKIVKGTTAGTEKTTSITVPDAELSRQRNEIVNEIMSAPIRRMDNLITETEDSARNLLLAMRVGKVLRHDYRQRELMVFSAVATVCLIVPAMATILSSVSPTGMISLALLSVAMGCGSLLAAQSYLKESERGILDSSDYVLNRLFTSKTCTKDVELRWHPVVKPEIMRVVSTYHENGAKGIKTLPACSARACRGMETVVNNEIPSLRRSVAEYKESFFRGGGSSSPGPAAK